MKLKDQKALGQDSGFTVRRGSQDAPEISEEAFGTCPVPSNGLNGMFKRAMK